MSLVQLQSSISDAIKKSQYNINTVFNASLYGVPFMTVGLIGVTSMVLAYVTIVESNDSSTSEPGSSESMIPSIPQMPEMPDLGLQSAISSVTPASMQGDELEETARGGRSRKTKTYKGKNMDKKRTRRSHKK
jgi:hypothetical protein